MASKNSSDNIPAVSTGSDDFLYHLYRGSEMLMHDRVVEAKEELERALLLQPQDAKSQDLLAGVYFRLGVYPSAIEIWERLAAAYPRDPTLRVNLGLALFKTGQAEEALHHVNEALRIQPDHERAWGYVGLIKWRQGRFEDARDAFLRGGQASMARRMEDELERVGRAPAAPQHAPTQEAVEAELAEVGDQPEVDPQVEQERRDRTEVLDAAEEALAQVEAGELTLDTGRDSPDAAVGGGPVRRPSGEWRAVEFGQEAIPPAVMPAPRRPPKGALALDDIVADWTARFSTTSSLSVGKQGELLIYTEHHSYVRMMALTAVRGELRTTAVQRRARGNEMPEPLGGDLPIMRWYGPVSAVAFPKEGDTFVPIRLTGDHFYVRESLLVAFDDALAFESAALPIGEKPAMFTQLHGHGTVVLSLPKQPTGVDVDGVEVRVDPDRLAGWTGRLFPSGPRGTAPYNATAPQLLFRGHGVVLVY